MRVALLLASFAVVAAGGFLVGQRYAPTDNVRTVFVDRGSAPLSAVVGAPAIGARGLAVDAETLRAIVREELARAGDSRAPSGVVAAGEHGDAAREPSAADVARDAAFGKARSVVDSALAAGVWTEDDRAAVRSAMTTLSREQVDELNRALVPALNEGRLRSTFAGFPL